MPTGNLIWIMPTEGMQSNAMSHIIGMITVYLFAQVYRFFIRKTGGIL